MFIVVFLNFFYTLAFNICVATSTDLEAQPQKPLESALGKRSANEVTDHEMMDGLSFTEWLKIIQNRESWSVSKTVETYYQYQEIKSNSFWREELSQCPFQVIQWPLQSPKTSIGGQVFFDVALNEPHQKLLKNALMPLINTEISTFEERLSLAQKNVADIIKLHPYFKSRFTLYSLCCATHLNHPIADLVLAEALKYLYLQKYKSLNEKKQKFFQQRQGFITVSLKNALDPLKQFIQGDDLNDFNDLQGEELNDMEKLTFKEQQGLIHYGVLKYKKMIQDAGGIGAIGKTPNGKYLIDDVIKNLIECGRKGDFEGYSFAADFTKGIVDCTKICKTDEEIAKTYVLWKEYQDLSYLCGNTDLLNCTSEEKIAYYKETLGVTDDLFKELFDFIKCR